ncbi:hypothetical protein RJ615_27220 [Klebsiella pneumoniae]|nr:hypothetical protein [Klebsiella pneumoniae]
MTDIHTLERLLRRLRLTRIATEWHSQEKRALAEGGPLRVISVTLQ